MSIQAGVGVSQHRHWKVAARESTEQALEEAAIKQPDLVLVFASVSHPQQQLIDEIRILTGGAPLAGCSGNGVIGRGLAIEDNFYVGVMALASDELRFEIGHAQGLKANSDATGREIGRELASEVREDALCLIALADGLTLNFDRFRVGMEEGLELSKRVPILGGLSGDNWRMQETYQYADDTVIDDGAVCILVSGSAKLAWSLNHGCVPIGEERKITRVEGNVIYELDGEPVLDVMKEYLNPDEIDNWERTVVNFSMGFKPTGDLEAYDDYLIRFMPSKDDEARSITIPTEVEPGTSVWITRRDKQKIRDGVERIAESVLDQLDGNPPRLVLQFDCAGRGKMVFREQEKHHILNLLQDRVGKTTPWIGFYTYGEIGPIGHIDCFHNYTMVLLAIK